MLTNPTRTMECPICGLNTPHEHSGQEVHEYREIQILLAKRDDELFQGQSARRLKCATKAREERERQIRNMEHEIERLRHYDQRHPCAFCSGLPTGPRNLKHDCEWLYGLKIDDKLDTASCPECGRVMVEWED